LLALLLLKPSATQTFGINVSFEIAVELSEIRVEYEYSINFTRCVRNPHVSI